MESTHQNLLNKDFKTYKESFIKQYNKIDNLMLTVVVLVFIIVFMSVYVLSLRYEINLLKSRDVALQQNELILSNQMEELNK